jgi:hypothetical protein
MDLLAITDIPTTAPASTSMTLATSTGNATHIFNGKSISQGVFCRRKTAAHRHGISKWGGSHIKMDLLAITEIAATAPVSTSTTNAITAVLASTALVAASSSPLLHLI